LVHAATNSFTNFSFEFVGIDGAEAIGVPLNDEAVAVLREERGKPPLRVFTFKGRPLVRRYAHFSPEQLRAAAGKLATFSYTPPKSEPREVMQGTD
jgi:hypothetical protein